MILSPAQFDKYANLPEDKWQALATRQPKKYEQIKQAVAEFLRYDSQVNQLVYYRPVSGKALRVHLSTAREFGIQGGNRSGKSGTALAEIAIAMTGVVPMALADVYPAVKILTPPVRVRLTVTSLISAWDTNLKLKLQWWEWSGKVNEDKLAGDPRLGHWGLIPQRFLVNGDWAASWSEKHRILTLTNGSKLQVMSHEQDIKDFNQGSFHLIVEDELPPEEIHRANKMRIMDVGGRIITGGTPPDDRSAGVSAAWFFDQILLPGLEGTNLDEVDAVALWTEDNRALDQADVELVAKGLTDEQRRARLHGEAIHLAGLIVKGFTERPRTWCFKCDVQRRLTPEKLCESCGGNDATGYCHVWDDADVEWPGPTRWPVLFYMDPHQSRPTACAWFKVDPQDGWWQIAEAEIAGDAARVRDEVERFEREHRLAITWRKGDPKITAQTNQFAREVDGRKFTIREAFEEVGFPFEEANTNFTVAIERLERALRPNRYTRTPQLRIHRTCRRTTFQLGRFTWDEKRRAPGMKEQPSRNHSDFPALLRYLAMDDPTYRGLEMLQAHEPLVIGAGGQGRGVTGW